MLSASTNFKNYIQQYGKEIALRISWDAIVITSEDVLSCVKWFDGELYKSVMQGLELEIEGIYDMTGKALLVEFGVSLNGSAIEWLTWGTFYVKSFSTIAASKSTKIEAYDAMLKSHIPYDLSPTYPITVGNYLQAICTRLGITLATPTFTNSSVSIPNEKYAMLDNILFRDVLTDLSEVSGGIIHIRADGQLAVKYPTATSETLNSNVKSLDVDKLFGEVNTLVLATTPAEDNTLREDLVSVASYGRHEVRFEDNQIMVLDPDSFIDNLFNTIKYTKYYPFDLDSFGYGYFEVGDIITVVDEDSVSYQTIVLGGEIKINAGFSEMMYARVPEMATTPDYDNAQRTISPRETIIRLDRQEKKILLQGEEISLKVDADGVISAINLSPELIKIVASKIALEGLVTVNDGFEILLDGSIIVNDGTFKGSIDTAEDATIGINLNMPIYVPSGLTDKLNILAKGQKGIRYGTPDGSGVYPAYITIVDDDYNAGTLDPVLKIYSKYQTIIGGQNYNLNMSSIGLFANFGANGYNLINSVISEYGTNASGENYIKYANGYLIKWKQYTLTIAISTAFGNIFLCSEQTVTFNTDIPFISAPNVFMQSADGTGNSRTTWPMQTLDATTQFKFQLARAVSQASQAWIIQWFAIGRWA